jgi:hypothetical protein
LKKQSGKEGKIVVVVVMSAIIGRPPSPAGQE